MFLNTGKLVVRSLIKKEKKRMSRIKGKTLASSGYGDVEEVVDL
ncbi:hypothetical protein [Nostoc sp.]